MTDSPRGHRYLEFAFLCDAASDKGGALDALGIGTTLVFARALPATHQFTLVLRVAWTGGPAGPEPQTIGIRIVDPDGEQIAGLRSAFGVDPEEASTLAHPEIPVGANFILPLPVQLVQPGVHQVEITLGDETYPPLPFKVVPVSD